MKLTASMPINRVPFIVMIATNLDDLKDLNMNRSFFVDASGEPTGNVYQRQWGDDHKFDILMYLPLRVSRVHDRLIADGAKGNPADIAEIFSQCDRETPFIRDQLIKHFKLNEVDPNAETQEPKDPAILKLVEALPIMFLSVMVQARIELYRKAFKWVEDMEFNGPEWGRLSIPMIKAHAVLTAKSDDRDRYAQVVASELSLGLI